MKRLILFVLALLMLPTLAQAQQTAAIGWEYPVALATVNTYTQSVRVDTTTITATPTCVATTPTLTSCTVPTAPLATGTHTLSVTASLNGITAQTTLSGVNPSSTTTAPQNPANIKYQINVVINVGGS